MSKSSNLVERYRCRTGVLLAVLATLAGCRSSTPDQPTAPPEHYLYSAMQIQDEKYLSVVNMPVQMPLIELERKLNEQLNGLIYEDDSYDDFDTDDFKAKVWKTAPIRVQAIDSTFLFEAPLKVWVSVRYKASPLGFTVSGTKETEFALRIRFLSKVHLTPQWKVLTETSIYGYDWISEPTVRVAGLNIPIKAMVSRMLNRNFDKVTGAIDEQVSASIELEKYARQAWALAREPVLVSEEYDTWLLVAPTEALMTPLVVKDKVLQTTVGLRGYTQTVTSRQKPEPGGGDTLPPLREVRSIPGEFKVGLVSSVSYKEAARLAEAKFVGERFSFSGGRYAVEVSSIDMYGQGDLLVIKAGLKGDLNGHIYLKGTPTYDPETQLLSLSGLNYDLDTRNVIVRTAGWLLQGKFSKMIEQRLAFPIGEQIVSAHRTIQQNLAGKQLAKGIALNGTLSELVPDRIYLTPDYLYSVVFAKGQVALKIDGLL